MKSIPLLLAGTAVFLAAAFTAVPVTAGIADLVLQPGSNPGKRTAPLALTSVRTAAPQTAANGRTDRDTDPGDEAAGEDVAGLVADTVDDARLRVSDLAADLQSGVADGEFSQADADRVLADVSGYIRGERTWPERA